MVNVFDGLLPEFDEPSNKKAIRRAGDRKPVDKKQKAPLKLMVNGKSDLFNDFQIGERDDNTFFNFKDVIDCRGERFCSAENMHIRMYKLSNGETVLRLYSYKTPVVQVSTSGGLEISRSGSAISATTKRHISAFLKSVVFCQGDCNFDCLVKAYGVDGLTNIGVEPVQFPRITVGMLNKAIKEHIDQHGNTHTSIKVESNYNVVETLPNGMRQCWYVTESLRAAAIVLIGNELISMNQIWFANRPDQIQKYFRTQVV